jgi:hypothetical protein
VNIAIKFGMLVQETMRISKQPDERSQVSSECQYLGTGIRNSSDVVWLESMGCIHILIDIGAQPWNLK